MRHDQWDQIDLDFRNGLALTRARSSLSNPPPKGIDPSVATISEIRRLATLERQHALKRSRQSEGPFFGLVGAPNEPGGPNADFPLEVKDTGDGPCRFWMGSPLVHIEQVLWSRKQRSRNAGLSPLRLAVVASADDAREFRALQPICRKAGIALGEGVQCGTLDLPNELRELVQAFKSPCSQWLAFVSLSFLIRWRAPDDSPIKVLWTGERIPLSHAPDLPTVQSVRETVGLHRTAQAILDRPNPYGDVILAYQGKRPSTASAPIPPFAPDVPWSFTIDIRHGIVHESIWLLASRFKTNVPKDLLNHEQAAKVVGKGTVASTVRRWIDNEKLTGYGQQRMVSKAEVEFKRDQLRERKPRKKSTTARKGKGKSGK